MRNPYLPEAWRCWATMTPTGRLALASLLFLAVLFLFPAEPYTPPCPAWAFCPNPELVQVYVSPTYALFGAGTVMSRDFAHFGLAVGGFVLFSF